MAISEQVCWEVIKNCKGQIVSSQWLKGEHSTDPPIENARALAAIERDLVLHHTKNVIEDSLYFLEKRGYLYRHGFHGLTRVVLQLSESALHAIENGTFSDDEQQAFREALIDVKHPGLWGLKFNLGEALRRIKKWWHD